MSSLIKQDQLKSVIHSGLQASKRLRKSIENLSEATLTRQQVCEIFRNQAELNCVNLAWNSVASLSVIHGQAKITQLQQKVEEQDGKIDHLNYRMTVHQLVIQRLLKAVWILSHSLQRMNDNQREASKMLKVVQVQVGIALANRSNASWANTLTEAFRKTVGVCFKYGLLVVISETILKMTNLLSMLKGISFLIPSQRYAKRFCLGARISVLISLIIVLRSKYDRLLEFLRILVKSL